MNNLQTPNYSHNQQSPDFCSQNKSISENECDKHENTDKIKYISNNDETLENDNLNKNMIMSNPEGKRLTIALVSDFFYPNLGGVEMHIYSLAYCLIELKHKVIIITHSYENRHGVRYLNNGIKCYYLPISTWPIKSIVYPARMVPINCFLYRDIFIRENVDIVHCHQTTSTLVLDVSFFAYILGYKTIVTDHSTWPLAHLGYIDINKLWNVFSPMHHTISVSHAVRENFIIRSNYDPILTSVIPNAIDASKFKPDPSKRYPVGTINIVVMSRQEYRKGFDLLVELQPSICRKYPHVYWIIGGDGSKMPILKFLVKRCNIEKQVEILGMVNHVDVADVQNRGHIFINTSQSEAFCIAVLEAVACGLKVVSTNVGGIPEILPKEMLILSEPFTKNLEEALEIAIFNYKDFNPSDFNKKVGNFYSWRDVAKRTETVYEEVLERPFAKFRDIASHIWKSNCSHQIIFLAFMMGFLFSGIFDQLCPRKKVETAIEFPKENYLLRMDTYGDHGFEVIDPKIQGNNSKKDK